jgi:hypothetical protein
MSSKEIYKEIISQPETLAMDRMYANHSNQYNSDNWGIWGKEKYTLPESQLQAKHYDQLKTLSECLELSPVRIKHALNFTYGLCNLSGYADPITKVEFNMLLGIYQDAIRHSSSVQNDSIRFLIQELYCIRRVAEENAHFKAGKLVNESDQSEIHRKYVHLDFFKFSLLNLLIRVETKAITNFSPSELASHLVLSWFLGVGSFLDKAAIFFSEQAFDQIRILLHEINNKIEESLEFPVCDYTIFKDELDFLIDLVDSEKRELSEEKIAKKRNTHRTAEFKTCNAYYTNYYQLNVSAAITKNPLSELRKLYTRINKTKNIESLNTADIKSTLRSLRYTLDEKYKTEIDRFTDDLLIKDFFDKTTHPYFTALQYECKILALLFTIENKDVLARHSIATIFNELASFYTCKAQSGEDLFDCSLVDLHDNFPTLVLAHHVHNANCDKLKDMMSINRLMQWPVEKQVCNISSSSSNHDIVKKEREICLQLGFNHYRIHARQHLKAGNQNRSIFNAINCSGHEYYLTLDDDYFIFPEFPRIAHETIREKKLDYYQAPLAFKGVFRLGAINGERADAEMMHYFESTSGGNDQRTYVFPRGTGTVFSFHNGISSLSDTGGFLINYSSEDFGQGFLSLLQDHGLKGKKTHTNTPGQMSERVLCIGEGVDLSGKIMQMIRWCHGTSKIYFHILIPALLSAIVKGKLDIFSNKQVQRILFFIPVTIASKLLLVLIYCAPLIYYLLFTLGITIPPSFKTQYFILLASTMILGLASISHYFLVQRKISFSPLRIFLMDNIITVSAVYGYISGLFKLKTYWWSNKSNKINLKQYRGAIFLFLVNVIVIPLAYRDQHYMPALWATINATVFFTGFFYLNTKGNYTNLYGKIPTKLFVNLFKIFFLISGLGFSTYIITMYLKIEDGLQMLLYSVILLYVINLFTTLSISSLYIIRQKPLIKNTNN